MCRYLGMYLGDQMSQFDPICGAVEGVDVVACGRVNEWVHVRGYGCGCVWARERVGARAGVWVCWHVGA